MSLGKTATCTHVQSLEQLSNHEISSLSQLSLSFVKCRNLLLDLLHDIQFAFKQFSQTAYRIVTSQLNLARGLLSTTTQRLLSLLDLAIQTLSDLFRRTRDDKIEEFFIVHPTSAIF